MKLREERESLSQAGLLAGNKIQIRDMVRKFSKGKKWHK